MVTVTIDITQQDERDILTIVKKIFTSHGLAQVLYIKEFLDWILRKKRKGLTINQIDLRTWHVKVPN